MLALSYESHFYLQDSNFGKAFVSYLKTQKYLRNTYINDLLDNTWIKSTRI